MVDSEIKSLEFLAGGGEMGERMRLFNWSATPLGKPQLWPQSLKTCVRIMLSSKQPIWIGWGSQLIKMYNDAYIDIVRGKHPIALGQPASVVWKDIWKDIEPLLSRAMKKDEGTYVESQLLIMERSGFPEETYYTFSYTPVLGADGFPAGMICYNTADTERIVNERSLRTMQQLDTLAQKKNEQEVYAQAAKALSINNRDFPFAVLYKIKHEGSVAEIVGSAGFGENEQPLGHVIDLQSSIPNASCVAKAVHENRIIESGSDDRWDSLPKGAWDVVPHTFLDVPIKSANKQFPLAILTVGLNPYRKFDDVYRNFIQLIVDQISLGVNNTLAYEEERKRAKALEELDKAKTLFFTNISHEFRTPLMLILGPLEELLNKPLLHLGEAEKQSIELTHRNALRLLKLVNALLDFSRIESGRHQANFVLTDIATYTCNLAANFRSLIEKADLQFDVRTEEHLPPVYLDKQMWEKIVFNLLSNAFKYTLKGTITLSLTASKGNVILTVEDTGVGIPKAELPRMFERFHRIQNASGRTHEGTGIGLSLIKELVQLHQGTITVESEEGSGSKFSVLLPIGKAHLQGSQVSEREIGFEISGSSLYLQEAAALVASDKAKKDGDYVLKPAAAVEGQELVMIVDDNADMRQHIESLIARRYNTITATNGRDALEKIQKQRPTLILSDIMMPEVDGIELLRRLKSNPDTAQIPIVLVTARAGEESKIEGYEIGADDYLVKPFSANEMLARIKAQIKIYKARKQVEQRLEGFLMQMPAAVSLVEGPEFKFIMANTLFQETFGRSQAELQGKTIREAFPEFKLQGIFELYHKVYANREPYVRHELPIEWNDREGRHKSAYFDIVIYPVNDGSESVNELMIHAVDTTMQVEARKRIEASEKQFRNVLLESPNIFAILKGPEMRIDFVNEPLLNSWGRTQDIVGKNLLEVLPEIEGQAFPRLLKSVFESGQAHYGNEEKATLMKNGSLSDIYYNYVYQPICDSDNVVSGITIMATDITEQVLTRKKVEASEEQFRTLTETLPQLVWMTNASGDLLFASRRWQEYSGKLPTNRHDWDDIVHPDDMAILAYKWSKSLSLGASYRIEVRLRNKSGDYRWHFGQGEPIKNDSEEIINWIGAFTDIHDQRVFTDKLEQKVQQRTQDLLNANKELESFNYIASHDLQEPLRKIQTFIHMIHKNSHDEKAVQVYYDKINSSAQRMSDLIQSVLTYSRLAKIGEDYTEVDLNEILKDIEIDFELLIAEKHAKILVGELPKIHGNSFQIDQLFSNLISNSLKFSTENPEIRIVSKVVTGDDVIAPAPVNAADRFHRITFSDNGIGFEQEFSEKIFSLFQRLHGKHEYSGTGIGLSIVKKIVEQHNGYIAAESSPGHGATFNIWFPV